MNLYLRHFNGPSEWLGYKERLFCRMQFILFINWLKWEMVSATNTVFLLRNNKDLTLGLTLPLLRLATTNFTGCFCPALDSLYEPRPINTTLDHVPKWWPTVDERVSFAWHANAPSYLTRDSSNLGTDWANDAQCHSLEPLTVSEGFSCRWGLFSVFVRNKLQL